MFSFITLSSAAAASFFGLDICLMITSSSDNQISAFVNLHKLGSAKLRTIYASKVMVIRVCSGMEIELPRSISRFFHQSWETTSQSKLLPECVTSRFIL